MKIWKFSTAVAATAILAMGAIVAPVASALDLSVKDGVCTTTESYDGEAEEIMTLLQDASDATIAELKKRLPGSAEDIDAILSWTLSGDERSAALERINQAGVTAGFSEGEADGILSLVLFFLSELNPDSNTGTDVPFQEDTMSQDEALVQLDDLEELLEELEKNQFPSNGETYTSSASAITVVSPMKSAYIELLEVQVEVLASCVAGDSGTFSFKPSPGGGGGGIIGGGGSAKSSMPSLSSR